MTNMEMTWHDHESWASLWRCDEHGEHVWWLGFVRINHPALRTPGVVARTEILRNELRRVLLSGPETLEALAENCVPESA